MIACAATIYYLPRDAWYRFAIWMGIGLVIYFAYGYRHSTLRRGVPPVPAERTD